jgi:cobalt-zinc-cadmium efflux system outer membrane protein
MQKYLCIIIASLVLNIFGSESDAQNLPTFRPDTLSLSLDSAEVLFMQKNYQLLAQRYNIDAQKALVVQAKLFPNPNFNISTPVYQTETHQFFPMGNDGEITMGLSQVITLAGKRNKQIRLAQSNAQLSEYQFFDLVRTLRHTLRSDFFNIYYLMQSAKVYDDEIAALQQITSAFAEQNDKGYIAEKEVIRIKAQLYGLQSEYNDLKQQINDLQSEVRLLLQVRNVFINPQVNTTSFAQLNLERYSLKTLIDSARDMRPDWKITKLNTDISKLNYRLQKAMAVPDLTLQADYDQQGSYTRNLASIGVAIDLPVFNRNKGNIKSAKAMIDFSKATQDAAQAEMEEQIYNALYKAIESDKLLKSRDASFESDFQRLQNEVLKNYRLRNISLLDFLDFYDSYKQNILQINDLNYQRISAFEDLNFYTGTDFFSLN